MISYIDTILNKITMYRVALYSLIFMILSAVGLAVVGDVTHVSYIPYGPLAIIFSTVYITFVCLAVNAVFAYIFNTPTNPESVYITALILVLIIAPIHSATDILYFALATWASVWAMASKYILAVGKKHIFNPAAIAVVITAFSVGLSANWWVGTVYMMPFVLVGGCVVVRKVQRFKMVASFMAVALIVVLIFHPAVVTLWKAFAETPLLFFAFIMLTEPLTSPTTQRMRIIYAVIVGLVFAPFVHLGSIYSTPELALIVGNVFAFIVTRPKKRLTLVFREKEQVATDTYHFWFDTVGGRNGATGGDKVGSPIKFRPGQYLEWTLLPLSMSMPRGSRASEKSDNWKNMLLGMWRIVLNIFAVDSRGVRRYFTIASSPGEEGIAIGVKVYGKTFGGSSDHSNSGQPSSFKKALMAMKPGDTIMASGLAGDFVLPPTVLSPVSPKTHDKRIVMMAGGIGITPFRSMVQDLLDKNEQRPIRIIYSNKTATDIAYKDVFDEARRRLGIKTVYTLTGDGTKSGAESGTGGISMGAIPVGWKGRRGFVNAVMIEEEVPGYMNCLFYLSGPRSMVVAFENILTDMGVPSGQIKKDFFPGFV